MNGRPDPPRSTKSQRFAWCLYDFGNSAYPTVITTALYVLHFKNVVVGQGDPGEGDRLWGLSNSLGALLVLFLAPFLGVLADRMGWRRGFLWAHAWVCVLATGLLAFAGSGSVALAMALLVLSLYAFETGNVFYNSFLPDLVPSKKISSLSGKAWALGYVGGLLCLLSLLPWARGNLRWVPLFVAAWFLVFTLPTLLLLRDRGIRSQARPGLLRSIGGLLKHRELARFLLPFFLFMNGLTAIYVFAGAFSAKNLRFSEKDIILLVVVLNMVAVPGALGFAWLGNRIGVKRSLLLSVFLWLFVALGAVFAASEDWSDLEGRTRLFWGVAVLAALCIGATQSLSRTFVGLISPPGRAAEFYGFMAFSGRGSAVAGPLLFGVVSAWFSGDQRWSVALMGGFFLAGFLLLLGVRDPGSPAKDPGSGAPSTPSPA